MKGISATSPRDHRPAAELDEAAQQLNRCRADTIRQVIQYDFDDIEDLRCGSAALKDPADPLLDWAEVRVAAGFS